MGLPLLFAMWQSMKMPARSNSLIKVGAIFKASDVFDSSHDLSQLVAHAEMDRHPFKYDTTQPTPGEQQRWVIVEQHATNNPTTGSK